MTAQIIPFPERKAPAATVDDVIFDFYLYRHQHRQGEMKEWQEAERVAALVARMERAVADPKTDGDWRLVAAVKRMKQRRGRG